MNISEIAKALDLKIENQTVDDIKVEDIFSHVLGLEKTHPTVLFLAANHDTCSARAILPSYGVHGYANLDQPDIIEIFKKAKDAQRSKQRSNPMNSSPAVYGFINGSASENGAISCTRVYSISQSFDIKSVIEDYYNDYGIEAFDYSLDEDALQEEFSDVDDIPFNELLPYIRDVINEDQFNEFLLDHVDFYSDFSIDDVIDEDTTGEFHEDGYGYEDVSADPESFTNYLSQIQ